MRGRSGSLNQIQYTGFERASITIEGKYVKTPFASLGMASRPLWHVRGHKVSKNARGMQEHSPTESRTRNRELAIFF